MIFNDLKLADYLTLSNLLSGILSIYFSFNSMFIFAAIAIFFGVFFDYLDGKVARMLKQSNTFGVELDSLADLVTFGVACAVLVYTFYNVLNNVYLNILLLFFVSSGAIRLARFNSKAHEKKLVKYFEGTPITLNGFLIPLLVLFNVNVILSGFIVLLLTVLMVSKVKIKHF